MRRILTAFSALAVIAALAAIATSTQASDHLEAPLVKLDGRSDVNDVYAFQSPTNPANTVLIMTVNPVAGVNSPTTFDPAAQYQFQIDNNGNARPDITYNVGFGPVQGSDQSMRVTRPGLRTNGRTEGEGFPLTGGGTAWAGLSDDPFFFDLQAFNDQVKGAGGSRTFCDATPTDFFAGFNVSSIVLEVPSAQLGGSNISVYGRTLVNGALVDRAGRPAIATALIPDGMEDQFNDTLPNKDRLVWGDEVKASLLFLSGLDGTPYTDGQAAAITNVLLPDVLTVDTSSTAGFLNGRQLADDVIDAELGVITGGFFGGSAVLTSDCVPANDVAFPGVFPYVAPPHLDAE